METALQADPPCVVLPAHAKTPWYGVFGSRGGLTSLQECLGDMLPQITAVDAGLSSDPGGELAGAGAERAVRRLFL